MIKNNETYGEITTLGQTQLLSLIKKDIPKKTIGKFLDILVILTKFYFILRLLRHFYYY